MPSAAGQVGGCWLPRLEKNSPSVTAHAVGTPQGLWDLVCPCVCESVKGSMPGQPLSGRSELGSPCTQVQGASGNLCKTGPQCRRSGFKRQCSPTCEGATSRDVYTRGPAITESMEVIHVTQWPLWGRGELGRETGNFQLGAFCFLSWARGRQGCVFYSSYLIHTFIHLTTTF